MESRNANGDGVCGLEHSVAVPAATVHQDRSGGGLVTRVGKIQLEQS